MFWTEMFVFLTFSPGFSVLQKSSDIQWNYTDSLVAVVSGKLHEIRKGLLLHEMF